VAESDRASLAVEVRDHEPELALFAVPTDSPPTAISFPGPRCPCPGGFIALEIGCGQHSAISTLLAEAGFTQIDFTSDLQGIQRVVTARR